VVSQVPPCNRIALVVLCYRHFQSSTLHDTSSFLSHVIAASQMSSCIRLDSIQPSECLDSNHPIMISLLKVPTPTKDIIHRPWKLEKKTTSTLMSPQPRSGRIEINLIYQTRCPKSAMVPLYHPFILATNLIMKVFIVSSPHRKSRGDISFKGGITPRVTKPIIIFIKTLIKE
jgi:hypothetical protein